MGRRIVSLVLTFWIVAVCPTLCFGHADADGHDPANAGLPSHDSSCDQRPCLCATSTATDTSAASGCAIGPLELCILTTARLARQHAPDACGPQAAHTAQAADALPTLDSIPLLI